MLAWGKCVERLLRSAKSFQKFLVQDPLSMIHDVDWIQENIVSLTFREWASGERGRALTSEIPENGHTQFSLSAHRTRPNNDKGVQCIPPTITDWAVESLF